MNNNGFLGLDISKGHSDLYVISVGREIAVL